MVPEDSLASSQDHATGLSPNFEVIMNEVTNMGHSPASETNGLSANQELHRLLWNPKVYYGVLKSSCKVISFVNYYIFFQWLLQPIQGPVSY
jgi:hypothetical protein